MHWGLPLRSTALAVCLLVGCSESGSRTPTAPDPPSRLAAAFAPAAEAVQIQFTVEIQTGQGVHFTIEVTGGDPDTEPSWTCASADTTVASAARTASGCSATGTGVGTTTITATVTQGTATATAAVGLRVTQPPLAGALAPAADTVQTGQTAQFTLEITGGDSSAEPAWTCASADTLVASVAATSFGCSATGTGTGATTISAAVTRGSATFSASAGLRVAGERDTFAYWDGNGNGDLTCTEARGKDEGLRLPAYRDNRDGTGLIYEWLERGRSSDSDDDGISCESTQNAATFPFGSRPQRKRGTGRVRQVRPHGWDFRSASKVSAPAMTETHSARRTRRWRTRSSRGCPSPVHRCTRPAATDIDHIVALAEAYDSGLPDSQFRDFAGDLANLTIADPVVNRQRKSDSDAGGWRPSRNTGWFAAQVVAVKQKYGLSLNPAERDALASMLASDSSWTVTCD